jgi:peroxiredoxin
MPRSFLNLTVPAILTLLAIWLSAARAQNPKSAVIKDLSAEARKNDPLAGHSAHGPAFNEGPRQAAYLMGGTGEVNLTVTTKSPEAQKFFNQGIGQLHGFWMYEAERSFRQAAALDPDCAMAYWGAALANFNNGQRSKGFIAEAVKRKAKASRREQLWIDGLNNFLNSTKDNKTKWQEFLRSFDELLVEFPQELEAKAFMAWAFWSADRSGLSFDTFTSIDSIIGQVLAENPLHPVHHYRIHLWDYKKPELALRSCALSGPSAPTVAHMWHMPGHIYWRLKRYQDSAWQFEASARADHVRMIRDRVMPFHIGNYAHNNEWCCQSLTRAGKVHDAVELAKNLIELPRHPVLNTLGNHGSSAHYGRSRLLEALLRYELWEETIALCHSMYLEPTEIEAEQIRQLRALGRAYVGVGDPKEAQQQIAALEAMLANVRKKQDQAGDDAERKARAAHKPEAQARNKPEAQARNKPEAQARNKPEAQASTSGTRTALEAPPAKSHKLQQQFAKARSGARQPFESQISQLTSAIDELRGRLLMSQGKHEEALALLAKTNGVLKEHLAQFHFQAAKIDKAIDLAKQAKNEGENEVYPLANYVDLLHRAGKKAEAQQAFAELRKLSQSIDLDMPVMRRVAAVARELNLPADWRVPRETPEDLGRRPPLASLGPFRWQPSAAESWTLPTGDSSHTVSLKDYRGKPVIVIFYLGYGCLHCAQQIEKFAPMSEQFRKAGIELVAVSSDAARDLQRSIDRYEKEKSPPRKFPFPLTADPELKIFKLYRAFDDFERAPLHGTFLTDGQGQVRWQDIGYQPFMDAEFLLKEAQRLLSQRADSTAHALSRRVE